jgi:hypothetical protein
MDSVDFDGPAQQLLTGRLLKAEQQAEDSWKICGVASDEGPDTQGDSILRKTLDLTYANARGFVNWNHSRAPADQLGFLTKCEVLSKGNAVSIAEGAGVDIPDTATVFVEGSLYPHVPRAKEVQQILKSMSNLGDSGGLGLSLDGTVARGGGQGVIKAFVRGIAVTPFPSQPLTFVRLRKMVEAAQLLGDDNVDIQGMAKDISAAVLEGVSDLLKKGEQTVLSDLRKMNRDEAALWILKARPKWSLEFAEKVVDFTAQNIVRQEKLTI